MIDNKMDVSEDRYLNELRKKHMSVAVYLVNGVKQYGHIESFDRYTILLRNGATQQILYKHVVASVMPTEKRLAQAKKPPSADVMEKPSAPATAPARAPATPVIIRKPPRRIVRDTKPAE